MSSRRVYNIRCNFGGCRQILHTDEETASSARQIAAEAGWTSHYAGEPRRVEDFCQRHPHGIEPEIPAPKEGSHA